MTQIKVELQESMGTDRSIAEAAWTSSTEYKKKKIKTQEDVEKLVIRLANDKHSTPFESVILRFWIKMPIQSDRQHMTHRIASHNGMSGRYRTMPDEWMLIPEDVDAITEKVNYSLEDEYNSICNRANLWYKKALEQAKQAEKDGYITNNEYKRFREFYRGVLPQNNMTERITIMNLRSFANYQKLRNSKHAQPEIQQIAKLMLEEVKRKNIAPVAIEWLEKNNWNL